MLSIRLPADLHARVKEMAKAEHRSMNGQITHLIQRALDGQKTDAAGADRPGSEP